MSLLSKNLSLLAFLVASVSAAENLGNITIDSTTIDDRFHGKKTEISTSSTISGEEVDNAHIENIQQVLQKIPGVTTDVQNANQVKIHIRGVENQRYMGEKPGVAVVIDGVPVFERTGAVNIDLDDIESIKVVKGGASYLFGEDALAGAVIITTKRSARHTVTATYERGSFNYYKAMAEVGHTTDKYSFRLQASERKSDGYWANSDYRTRYVNGKFQYFINDTSDLTFGFEKSYRAKDSHGTVGGITQAKNDPESVSTGTDGSGRDFTRMYDVDLLKLYATYSKDFESKSNFMLNGYYYGDKTKYVSSPQKYTAAGAVVTSEDAYTTGNNYSQAQRGVKSEFRKSGNSLAYMLGLDVRNNNYKNITSYITDFKTSAASPTIYTAGTITGDNKTTEEVYAPYTEVKYALSDKLTLTLNGRYDDVRYKYEDYKNNQTLKSDFEIWSQRIGVAYQASSYATLFFNRSTGFRTPSVTQLYAGTTSLDGKTENNPNLKPEHSVNYDIGSRGDVQIMDNKGSYELAFFWLDRKNYISSILGDYSAATATNHQRYENVGGMRSKGIELSINSDNKKPIWIEAAYTYLDAKFTGSDSFYLGLGNQYVPATYSQVKYDLRGKSVPRTSRDTFDITVGGRPTPTTIVSLEYLNKSGYFADEINQLKMEGYDVFNLIVRHTKKIGKFTVEAFARVDNLCDRRYIANARASSDRDSNKVYDYEDFTATVNPGRVWTAGMSMKF